MTSLNHETAPACLCCRLPHRFVAIGGKPNHLEIAPKHQLCGQCMLHQGRTPAALEKRDLAHVALWQKVFNEEHDRDQALLDQAERRAEELMRELADRPVRVVERDLDAERVDKARQQMEAVFRSRDHAYEDLMAIRLLHRDNGEGRCRCGRKSFNCKEFQIVGRSAALAAWERKQIERARGGLDHLLPDNHPALSSRSWTGWDETS